MADSRDSALRPETLALDALIKATVSRASHAGEGVDALLFMGNWHQAVPSILIQDPVLEPVDKVVWMVIMLGASAGRGHTAFPDYESLMRKANVASTATISRALAILRLTRWLTQCAQGRPATGRFAPNLYILHDEPLPLADALYLDDAYMQFVQQAQQHHHARVRCVAQAVLDGLDLDIQAGRNLGERELPVERRLQAAQVLSSSTQNRDRAGRYFMFPVEVVQRLQNTAEDTASVAEGTAPAAEDRLQNSKAVDQFQNLKAVEFPYEGSSSCSLRNHYKNTTTTTTTENSARACGGSAELDSPAPDTATLIYPPRLSDNQRLLADRYLAMIAPEDRQPVLDELQGRLASEHKGMQPVYDELRFLHSLCKSAQQGQFVPNLGIKVVEARQERTQHVPSPKAEPPDPQVLEARARAKAFGEAQLAKLRESLGMTPRSDDP